MRMKLSRIFKEPLVLLLLTGACIYGGYLLFQKREKESEQAKIHINAGQIDGMIMQWEKRWNRPPTREEIDGLIQQQVREEILYRQAVAMGLDKNDPITRRRTVQKLEFLTNDIATSSQPTDAVLQQYLSDNEAKYRSPAQISFSQAFFNPDSRDETTLDDAKAALADLGKAGKPDPETLSAGDRSMMRSHFPSVTEMDIRREMGSGFAEAVMKLEPDKWHGPVLSGYGVHLVYVYDFQEGALPKFELVKDKVLADWQDAQREKLNSDLLEGLKERYDIVIDEVPEDRLIARPADSAPGDPSGGGEES